MKRLHSKIREIRLLVVFCNVHERHTLSEQFLQNVLETGGELFYSYDNQLFNNAENVSGVTVKLWPFTVSTIRGNFNRGSQGFIIVNSR